MKVAKTYQGYTYDENKAYTKEGKLYVKAKCKCDRCGGLGIIASRVENGRIIPIPVDAGICYKCEGKKFVTKEIRLYTDEEYAKMEKANAKAAEKREAAREAKMKAEYAEKKAKWIADEGFNEEGTTYIYGLADSYEKKDELKAAGFRFNYTLFWHCPTIPEGYEEKVFPLTLDECVEFSAWGKGVYKLDTKKNIEARIKATEVQSTGWFGEIKEKFTDVVVTLKSVKAIETRFGVSNLVRFFTEDGQELNWWTTVVINAEAGSTVLLSGTVKDHTIYNDNKITTVTRCKIKEIE